MSGEIDIYGDLENLTAEKKSDQIEVLQKKYIKSVEFINELQSEIKDLQKKLKNIERSFWSLLETAKIEVNRKDNQIAGLRQEIDNITFRRYNNGKQNKHERYVEKQERNCIEKFNLINSKKDLNKEVSNVECKKKLELTSENKSLLLDKEIEKQKPKNVTENCPLLEDISPEKEKNSIDDSIKSKLLKDVKKLKKKPYNTEKTNTESITETKAVSKNFDDLLFDEMLNEETSLNIKINSDNRYEDLNNIIETETETVMNKTVDEYQNEKIKSFFETLEASNIKLNEKFEEAKSEEEISKTILETEAEAKKIEENLEKCILDNDSNKETEKLICLNLDISKTSYNNDNTHKENREKHVLNSIIEDKNVEIDDKNENKNEIPHFTLEKINNSDISILTKDSFNITLNKFGDTLDLQKCCLEIGESEIQKKNINKLLELNGKQILKSNHISYNECEVFYNSESFIKRSENDKLELNKVIPADNISNENGQQSLKSNILLLENNEISTNVSRTKNENNLLLSKRKYKKLMGHRIDGFEPENDDKQIEEALKLKKNLFKDILSKNAENNNIIIDKKLSDNFDYNTINSSNISTISTLNNTLSGDQTSEEVDETIKELKELFNFSIDKNNQINSKNITLNNEETKKENQIEICKSVSFINPSIIHNLHEKNIELTQEPLQNLQKESYPTIDICLPSSESFMDIEKKLDNELDMCYINNKKEISNIFQKLPNKMPTTLAVSSTADNEIFIQEEICDRTSIIVKEVTNETNSILDSNSVLNNYKVLNNNNIILENKTSEIPKNFNFGNKIEELLTENYDKVNVITKVEKEIDHERMEKPDTCNISKIENSFQIDKSENSKSNQEKKDNLLDINKVEINEEVKRKNTKYCTKINILENIQIAPPKNDLVNSSVQFDGCQINENNKNSSISHRDIKPKILKPDVKKILPLLYNSLEINKAATDELVKILDNVPKINRTPKKHNFDTIKRCDVILSPLKNNIVSKSPICNNEGKNLSEKIDVAKTSDLSPNQSETLEATKFLTDHFLINKFEKSPLKSKIKQSFTDKSKQEDIGNEINILNAPEIGESLEKLEYKCIKLSNKVPIIKISKKLIYPRSKRRKNKNKKQDNVKTLKRKSESKNLKKNDVGNDIIKANNSQLQEIEKTNEVFENSSKENSAQLINNQSIIDSYLKECNKSRELENDISKKVFKQTTQTTPLNALLENNFNANVSKVVSPVDKVNLDPNVENGKDLLQKQINDIFGQSPFNLEYSQENDYIFNETLNKSSDLNNSTGSPKILSTLDKIYEMKIDSDGTPIWNITKKRKRKRKILESPENSTFENENENVKVKKSKMDENLINAHNDDDNNGQVFYEKNEITNTKSILNSTTTDHVINVETDFLSCSEKNYSSSYKIPKIKKTLEEITCDKDFDIISNKSIAKVLRDKQCNNESFLPLSSEHDIITLQENLDKQKENSVSQQFKSPKRIELDMNKSCDNDIEQEFLRIFGKSPNFSQNSEIIKIDDNFDIQNNEEILTTEKKTVNNNDAVYGYNNRNVERNEISENNLVTQLNTSKIKQCENNNNHIESFANISTTSLNTSDIKQCFSTSTKTYEMVCDESGGTNVNWIITRKKKKKKTKDEFF